MSSGEKAKIKEIYVGNRPQRRVYIWLYRTRRNFRGGLIVVLFAGEVDPRKLMRTKI